MKMLKKNTTNYTAFFSFSDSFTPIFGKKDKNNHL